MAYFFTSDQHYSHANLIKHGHRLGFSTVEEMDEALIRNHNEVVMPQDEVWHLGDFSNDFEVVERILPRLRGIHRLVVGNHDECHPSRRAAWKMLRRYREAGFEEVYEHVVLGGSAFGKVMLCHLPMGSADHDNTEPRYMAWRPTPALLEETGCVALLHGHVHEAWRVKDHPRFEEPDGCVTIPKRAYGNTPGYSYRMINVGVDVNEFRLVSDKDVGKLLK